MVNKSKLTNDVVSAIRAVVGSKPVALHEPSFNGNEILYLKKCITSTFVSSVGKFVDRFELDLANYTGAKHAIAMVNGTAALHIAIKLSGVKTDNEVLIPAMTFVATANAVVYCNAVPHFVDSELCTLGIDAVKLRDYLTHHTEQRAGQCIDSATGRVIRTMVPMHTFGHPSNLFKLLAIAHDFNIMLIEDAAESLGSCYKGQHTGTFGLMGTISITETKLLRPVVVAPLLLTIPGLRAMLST